jgi:hypothetical protein
MSENTAQDFLFGGAQVEDDSMSVFDKKTKQSDGIYRPSLNDAKDKKQGYRATLRFLPNLLENGKQGPLAIEKHIHYVDMKNEPNLAGYYDCNKNHENDCPICTEYWKLYNSNNGIDKEKAKMIKRSTKYYSYVQIIEDEQHPELVGKIMVYAYGFTIKSKINSERHGEVSGVPCKVFNLNDGKDFRLIIKEKGGFANYDMSAFLDVSSIKIFNEKTGKFMQSPTYKDKNGNIIIGDETDANKTQKIHSKILDFLNSKTVNLDDYAAKKWDTQVIGKVNNILSILSGNVDYKATQTASNVTTDATTSTTTEDFDNTATDADDFFELDD